MGIAKHLLSGSQKRNLQQIQNQDRLEKAVELASAEVDTDYVDGGKPVSTTDHTIGREDFEVRLTDESVSDIDTSLSQAECDYVDQQIRADLSLLEHYQKTRLVKNAQSIASDLVQNIEGMNNQSCLSAKDSSAYQELEGNIRPYMRGENPDTLAGVISHKESIRDITDACAGRQCTNGMVLGVMGTVAAVAAFYGVKKAVTTAYDAITSSSNQRSSAESTNTEDNLK